MGFREFVKTESCMHYFVRMCGNTIIFAVGENKWLSLEYQRNHNFKTTTIINKRNKTIVIKKKTVLDKIVSYLKKLNFRAVLGL